MSASFLIISFVLVFAATPPGAVSEEVCYDRVGCFNNDYPFDNAGGQLPEDPDAIGTEFLLYTRDTPDEPEFLVNTLPDSVTASLFDVSRLTKVIIHGWGNDYDENWVQDIKDALLVQGDYNVIIIDWSEGADDVLDYDQDCANVRLVATELELLLLLMERVSGLAMQDVHMMGHSLGAHIAGYAGTLLGGSIGRISGMDAADPNFQNLSTLVRLDPSDAQYVDVIHTDGQEYQVAVGFGIMQPSGHIDFYVNGGEDQAGCEDGITGSIIEVFDDESDSSIYDALITGVSCSHSRAHDIFLESILSTCKFKTFPCSDYESFLAGDCYDCGADGCGEMGFFADNFPKARGLHYLLTFDDEPFCGEHYFQFIMTHSPTQEATMGDLHVALRSSTGDETRLTSVFANDLSDIGDFDVNRAVVLDRASDELDGGASQIILLYTKREGVLSLFSQALDTFTLDGVEMLEVATGKRFVASGTRTLTDGVEMFYSVEIYDDVVIG